MTDRIAEIRARRCMTDSEIIRAALTDDGALAALDRLDASVERLREALLRALDCKGSYNGLVSELGGEPALCTKCEKIARAALHPDSGEVTTSYLERDPES